MGENGTGKSTLLEAIAVAMGFNPEGGSRNFNFATNSNHSELFTRLKLYRGTGLPKDGFFLRAESFYNAATYIDELGLADNYGGKSLHEQSHGEAFLSLISNRFRGNGLYILDEPEAALSPQRLLSLMVAVDDLVKKNSQMLIATHSPILMAYPKAEIFQLTEQSIQKVAYKDTEHYMITKRFLERPEQMLKYLLENQA